MDGKRMLVNGVPYRMKSALVQGFTADRLYAEGSRADIVGEVQAAEAMGFNTLRLHIKAFDPTYLDVCDELGMFLHCDIPVAEPLNHREMGGDTVLTRHCVAAARAQVRRDRNHPSVILWSAMNEVCEGKWEARHWPGYEQLARAMFDTITSEDPTRPVIENDWIEPDPDYVFCSPILTAHWYGRLHRDYLDTIEAASARAAGEDRPLFVTEYGDWGLPDMPVVVEPPFWDFRPVYAAGLASAQWPGSIARFIVGTQRYQGVSNRMQTEVWRRHEHIGGYCVTELTDVPQELNGLLDLFRRPKRIAVAETARANQTVLPMLAPRHPGRRGRRFGTGAPARGQRRPAAGRRGARGRVRRDRGRSSGWATCPAGRPSAFSGDRRGRPRRPRQPRPRPPPAHGRRSAWPRTATRSTW